MRRTRLQEVARARDLLGEVLRKLQARARDEGERVVVLQQPAGKKVAVEGHPVRDKCGCAVLYLLVGGGADVDAPRLAPRFKLAGQSHVVAKQAVTGHFHAHHPGQNRPGVDADS